MVSSLILPKRLRNIAPQYIIKLNKVVVSKMPNGSGLTITFRLMKENIMFNFKSVVDQVAQASKTPLTFVEDKAVRSAFESTVDSYAEFTKSMYDTSLDLSQYLVETTKTADYTKFFKFAK